MSKKGATTDENVIIVYASWYKGKYESNLYGSVSCNWNHPYEYLNSEEKYPLSRMDTIHLAAYSVLAALRRITHTTLPNITRIVLGIQHKQIYNYVDKRSMPRKNASLRNMLSSIFQMCDILENRGKDYFVPVYIERDAEDDELVDFTVLKEKSKELAKTVKDPYELIGETNNKMYMATKLMKNGARCLRNVRK